MTGVNNGKAQIADVAKNNEEFRVYIPGKLKRIIKTMAGLKNSGRDWTMGDIATEALEDWLKKTENAELVKRHKLDEIE
jgi:hypothetical protein